jgi:alkylhydroperoxidase family enzyme
VERVLADHRTAGLSEKERALFDFVERVNSSAPDMKREEVEAAKRAGWPEEALYDAITVSALFNFYNRWCDAAGVHAFPREVHRMMAKHMAAGGYTMEL